MTKIVPDDRARQGPTGRPVLGVLIGALALCLGARRLHDLGGSKSPDAQPSQEASRQATTGSPSGIVQRQSHRPVPPANPAYPVPPTARPRARRTVSRRRPSA